MAYGNIPLSKAEQNKIKVSTFETSPAPQEKRLYCHQLTPDSFEATMSRRKVRGLTRTGRQVSEDPDLDNLLSTLSPEEMEELEKDMMKVPDLNPEDGKIIDQGDNQPSQRSVTNNARDAKLDGKGESDPKKRLSQREQSLEVCERFDLILYPVWWDLTKKMHT